MTTVTRLERHRISVDGSAPMPVQKPANDALSLVVYEDGPNRSLRRKPLPGADKKLVETAARIVAAVTTTTAGTTVDYSGLHHELSRIVHVDGKTIEATDEVALAAWSAIKAVERGDVRLVRCPNCDRFWFGRRFGDLCDRPVPGGRITCEQQGALARMKEQSDWPRLYRAMYARVLRGTLPRPVFDLWNSENKPAATDEPVDVDTWLGTQDGEPMTELAAEARGYLDERYWAIRAAARAAAERKEE